MFNELGALTMRARKLIIITSSWCFAPFISMRWPSLSHLTNVILKFTLSKFCYFCLFSGAISLVNLPAFHPKPVFISVNRCVSCKEQIVGSFYLIHFAKWCLLMGELSPLTLSVSIDKYVVTPAS
jgi:hypothetical protein